VPLCQLWHTGVVAIAARSWRGALLLQNHGNGTTMLSLATASTFNGEGTHGLRGGRGSRRPGASRTCVRSRDGL